MKNVARFSNVMAFEAVDRLPVIEWAPWWDKTVERWYVEGLPGELKEAGQIREYLGLDDYRQLWVRAQKPTCPQPASHGASIISSAAEYQALMEHLYPEQGFDRLMLGEWAAGQGAGDTVVWLTLGGFFWFPRVLLGIEGHLYGLVDQPELVHAINRDLLAHNLRVLDEVCEICRPDFMTFAEDMSYNKGPMLSKGCFDEFVGAYYQQIIPEIRRRGIVPIVDSDGDVAELIGWLDEVGVEGILPLERMAGVDVAQIRRDRPGWKMIGGFDKTVMHLGEDAMRREFERLLPVMRQGGFIASVDHQTPPDVSLAMYRLYVSLLKEYCQEAASS